MSLQKDNDAMARLYTESVDESLLDKLSVDYPAEVEQLYHDAAAMETFRRFLMSGDYPDAADALMSAQPSDEPEPEHDRGLTGRSEDPRHKMEDAEEVDESLLDEIRKYLDDRGAAVTQDVEARRAAGEKIYGYGIPATDGIIEDLQRFGMNGIKSLEDFKASEAASEYSDAYKDRHGQRPGRGSYHWSDHSADEWEKIINDLYEDAKEQEPEKEEPYEHKNSDEPVNDMEKAFAAIGESVTRPKSVYQEMSELYTEGVQSTEE
jgi:hypothetical protein